MEYLIVACLVVWVLVMPTLTVVASMISVIAGKLTEVINEEDKLMEAAAVIGSLNNAQKHSIKIKTPTADSKLP